MGGLVEGKVAVVTGAGSGIGEAMAVALHKEGAKVVVADISGCETAVAQSLGESALAVNVDVTSSESVAAMIGRAVDHFGRLDVLVNNAGIDGEAAPVAECGPEAFDKIVAVNLRGVFLGIHHAVPAMLKSGGGSIINTSSATAFISAPNVSAYIASKAGVLGLTRAAAADYSHLGVRVNAILPGIIQTPMYDRLEYAAPEIHAHFKALGEGSLSGRVGRTDEVAAVTVFLASDAASYVTAASIPVDGGYTA